MTRMATARVGPGARAASAWARAKSYLELLLVTVIWGGGGVAIKVASEGFAPLTASALHTGLASAIYLPLLLLLPGSRDRPRPGVRDLPIFALLALFGFFVFNVFYFEGLQRTTAVHGALIWSSSPVATAVAAALFLREPPRLMTVLGVLVSTLGVGAIILSGTRSASAGGARVTGDMLPRVGAIRAAVFSNLSPLRALGLAYLIEGARRWRPCMRWQRC